MYEIRVKASFSAAHNLRQYRGKCERLHGHNWNIEANFAYKSLGKDGMAVDFKEAKGILHDILDELDHSYLNESRSFKKVNPTSENIARFIFGRVKEKNKNIRSVAVWENDSACAVYTEG